MDTCSNSRNVIKIHAITNGDLVSKGLERLFFQAFVLLLAIDHMSGDMRKSAK